MGSTLLLDAVKWDLVLDTSGNIAVADEPYALAQDAASAIKTFLGECSWDTTLGIPYLQTIFSKQVSPNYIKSVFVAAALTVPDVSAAVCYLISLSDRTLAAQIQVTSETTGQTSAATFTVINPQGVG